MIKNVEADFTLLVASVESQPQAIYDIDCRSTKAKLRVQYGDYSKALRAVVDALQQVREHMSHMFNF